MHGCICLISFRIHSQRLAKIALRLYLRNYFCLDTSFHSGFMEIQGPQLVQFSNSAPSHGVVSAFEQISDN